MADSSTMKHSSLLMLLFGGYLLLPATLDAAVIRDPNIFTEPLVKRLWEEVCKEGDVESGMDGDDFVFCAYFRGIAPITVTHKPIELNSVARSAKGNQYIVIDPPWYRYNHKVTVTGDRSSDRKTTIFVRAPKHRQAIQIVDQTKAQGKPQEPSIVYLKPPGSQAPEEPEHEVVLEGSHSEIVPVEAESVAEAVGVPPPAAAAQLATGGQSSEVEVEKDSVAESNFGGESTPILTPGVFRLGSGARMQYTI